VLLLDRKSERLSFAMPEAWDFVTDDWDRLYLEALSADLFEKVQGMGGTAVLEYLEDTLSNVLQISSRTPIDGDTEKLLVELYERFVGADMNKPSSSKD
jgi:hypothetical protein